MRTRWKVFLFFFAVVPPVILGLCLAVRRPPAFLVWTGNGDDRTVEDDEQRRVAVHEAGHAVVIATLRSPDEVKSVVVYAAVDEHGGYGVTHDKTHNRLQSAPDILKDASVYLGGRAADKLVNGAPTDGATGDLANVNRIIAKMHAVSGLGDSLRTVDPNDPIPEVDEAIRRDITRANVCAEAIVGANKDLVKKLAGRIMDAPLKDGVHALSGDEFRAFLKKNPLRPVVIPADAKNPCAF